MNRPSIRLSVVVLLINCGILCSGQDTSALLTGILGSLTSTSKDRGCPGECVHAITSLLCEQILADGQCGAAYLRCCVTTSGGTTTTTKDGLKPTVETGSSEFQPPQTSLEANVTDGAFDKRVEPDVPIETVTASNVTTQTKSQDESADNLSEQSTCPGACVSETFSSYCQNPIPEGRCSEGSICCLQEDSQRLIEKKSGNPIECPGSCVSSLFSLLCDKVDYTATCSSGGACCLNPEPPTTTTTPTPPTAPASFQQCPGRCLPNFMHNTCRGQGKYVVNSVTNCPPATICCSGAPNEVYTNDRGPDGPGIILTGSNGARPPPFPPSAGFSLPSLNNQQSSASQSANSQPTNNGEMFGVPRPIQEETVGPITSAELVTKIASTIHCPGSCIAPLMKFTCFGSNNVYPHFKCTEGYVCCADTGDAKRILGNAIILYQVGSLAPPEPSIPLNEQDRPMFEPPRPPSGNYPPVETNKLNPANEPQESQLQPVNVRGPPPPSHHGFPHQLNKVPTVVPSAPQGGFVPAFRPNNAPSAQGDVPENVPLGPSPSVSPPALTPAQPQPASQPAPLPLPVKPPTSVPFPSENPKAPSFQINVPNQGAFLGSKNFNRPFKPIALAHSPNSGKVSPPVLTSGGFVPASSPPFSLSTPVSHLEAPHKNQTSSKSSNRDSLSCGRKGSYRQQRVIGGRNAHPGEWCWQAAIYNDKGQYVCGGALIGPQWIVTAAHCVTKYVRNGDSFFVEVGSVDLTSQHGHSRKKAWASYIHHNYNENTLDNDVALVKVLNPFNVNSSSACIVCLPGKHGSKVDQLDRCTVTGYGARHEGGPVAMKIREVNLPMVEERDCVTKLSIATEKQFKLPASTFCAGGEDGSDACQGDGGSPMVCDMGGFYELKGLVSWGLGCGRQDVPGVYVKVSSFIGWINQIISVNAS